MFTGLVETMGRLDRASPSGEGSRLVIGFEPPWVLEIGESINTNGVCLTAAEAGEGWFAADVMPETERKSTLGGLKPGARLHLERAMSAGGRFGGHIVQGHVDGVGRVVSLVPEGNARVLTVAAEPELLKFMVIKGSVAVDGASLTVSRRRERDFSVSLVAHTLASTALGELGPGGRVNLEVDIIGKYIYNFLITMDVGASHGVSEELLRRFDYI